MFDLIKAYKKYDPAAKSSFEIICLYPGLKALIAHRLAHRLYRYRIPFIPRFISELTRFITGIEIHPGARIGVDTIIDHGMGVVIGETAVIGRGVIIYQGVTLGSVKTVRQKRHPTIEDGVVLGAGSKVLGNIIVGANARVGANSVVVTHVPANCTVAGIPAKLVNKNSIASKEWEIDFQI